MVVKTLFKTVKREISRGFGRFAAIFAITALGVGFLAGLLSTAPDFYKTIDAYYDNCDFMDINIKSTGGLTGDDLDAVKGEKSVENAALYKTADVIIKDKDGNDSAARIYGCSDSCLNNKSGINKTSLKKGRYPKNENECLALVPNPFLKQPEIGTVYKLDNSSGTLTADTLTVVGVVESPMYMSVEKESTDIGNGRISVVLYTGYGLFNTDYYTDIFLTVKGAKDLNAFYAPYEKLRDKTENALKDIAKERETARQDELKQLAVNAALSSPEGKAAAALGLTEQIKEQAESKIEKPVWYILDRDANVSFVSLTANAEKVNSIAKVFPVFFFLVAALVALTTMTRMVDEQRTEIGTLKALGYTSRAIAAKYLVYSGTAAVTGGALGLAIGLYLLPTVIINVYHIMYRLPEIKLSFNPAVSLSAYGAALVCILAATLFAVAANLKEVPSRLMLPKAPKSGKRILLERVGFIWKRMKFTHKVTARNLFRYKKRFFMTVIGISGCTALLLTGFGLKDAIGAIVPEQYENLQLYDLTVELSDTSRDKTEEYLNGKYGNTLKIHAETGSIKDGKKDYEINLYVPSDVSRFKEYMNIRERKSGKAIALENSGVIITEKFALEHNIKKGDFVTIKSKSGKTAKAKVCGVCENYIHGYVYITGDYYMQLFGNTPDYSTVLIKSGVSAENEDSEMKELLSYSGISSASFSSAVIESFNNMIKSINYIVLVLILSACMLAFVVLYNLTNINISERVKEIATIKVLGFYDREVNSYVCRETYILSAIGTAVGLVLGILLCRFVVLTAEIDIVMFGRKIYPMSYVFAAVITIAFTVLVNLALSPRLKRIDMVESMKSVD